jgi:hypothetical protein
MWFLAYEDTVNPNESKKDGQTGKTGNDFPRGG